jgi:hypothetical protein
MQTSAAEFLYEMQEVADNQGSSARATPNNSHEVEVYLGPNGYRWYLDGNLMSFDQIEAELEEVL